MGYGCYCKGGLLKAKDKEAVSEIIEILNRSCIDAEPYPKDSLDIDIYSSSYHNYDEEDYVDLAPLCENGSYLDFFGDDDNVWSLTFDGDEMHEVPGIIEWRPEKPKVKIPLGDGFSLFAEQNSDPDYKEIAVSLMAPDGHIVQDLAMVSEEYRYEGDSIVPLHGQYSVKVWSDPNDENWQTKTVIDRYDEYRERCRDCGAYLVEGEHGEWICNNLEKEIHEVPDEECEANTSHIWADDEEKTCCICGCPIDGYGNDPWPVSEDPDEKCCDICNKCTVIPARLRALRRREEKPKKRLSLDCCCMPPEDAE